MRQRKAKNLEQRLAVFADITVADGKNSKGNWKSLFQNGNDIYMELGCGKGQFSLQQATLHPDKNFIAVEGQESVILRALEKTAEAALPNVRFMQTFIRDVTDYFSEGELAGIYLNFSDPWPKERHAKRRLTHTRYLKGYEKILKAGGFIAFKTDNDGLFDFSIDEIQKNGYTILEHSRDLHHSDSAAKEITTEYEDKFKSINKNINYVKFKV